MPSSHGKLKHLYLFIKGTIIGHLEPSFKMRFILYIFFHVCGDFNFYILFEYKELR